VLGFAINSLSQGIAYFHAGGELMRSKSMDRNSFDSGDWFNRIDWSGKSHAFGSGLPPGTENSKDYASMLPLLNQPNVRPKPEHIARSLRSFLDWVHIRRSIPELRLESAKAIQNQLKFLDFDILDLSKRAYDPSTSQLMIAAHIAANQDIHQPQSKAKSDSPPYRGIAYVVNGSFETQRIRINALKGRTLRLHPRLQASAALERRDAVRPTWDAKRGVLTIPRQSALLFFDKD
jgi:pullulanase/glycogen debranching enzyme